jgi:hypothetical protein
LGCYAVTRQEVLSNAFATMIVTVVDGVHTVHCNRVSPDPRPASPLVHHPVRLIYGAGGCYDHDRHGAGCF